MRMYIFEIYTKEYISKMMSIPFTHYSLIYAFKYQQKLSDHKVPLKWTDVPSDLRTFYFQQLCSDTLSCQRRFQCICKRPLDHPLLKSFNLFKSGRCKEGQTSIMDANNFPSTDPRRFFTR